MSDTLTAPDTGADTPKPRKPAPSTLTDQQRSTLSSAMAGFQSYRGRIAGDRADADALTPRPPTLTPPPKQEAVTDPFQAFGQPAMFLAIFGSLLTRNHLTNAIQAMGGALKGTHDQDAAIAKQNYETWKIESENAMKMAKYTQDAYSAAIRKMGVDANAGRAEFETQIAAFRDDVMQNVYQSEGLPGVKKLLFARGKQAGAMASGAADVTQHVDTQGKIATGLQSDDPAKQAEALNLYADTLTKTAGEKKGTPAQRMQAMTVGVRLKAIAADLQSGDPTRIAAAQKEASQMPEVGPGVLKPPKIADKSALTGEALDKAAQFYHATHQLPPGFGGQADRDAIQNREAQMFPEAGGAFAARLSGFHADTTSLQNLTKIKDFSAAAQERAAGREFDLAVSLLPKGAEPLDSQLLTRWARTGETQFGDVDVPKYQAALISGLDEYAKILSGATGVAGSTDASRAQALSLIPAGATSDQVGAIVYVLKQGMGFKLSSYDSQISAIRGRMEGGGGSAAGKAYKYNASGAHGVKIHSDDGSNWFTPDGQPYGAP